MWLDREKLKFINYDSKDFNTIKSALRDYIRTYFSEEVRSFSTGTNADIMLNLNAYVGDMLNFYIDKQFSELFLDRAIETKNIYGIAKGILGYNPKGFRSATTELTLSVDFPEGVTGSMLANYKFRLPKYSKYAAKNIIFETTEDLEFDPLDETSITAQVNGTLGPFVRLTKNNVRVVSGTTKTHNAGVDEFDYFPVIIIPEFGISQIISVVDDKGNVYEQVDNLAQNVKDIGIATGDPSTPYKMELKRVPYRFTADLLADGRTRLTFGNGDDEISSNSYIPTMSEFIDDNKINGTFTNFLPSAITINNFTRTNTLGIRPTGNLTITYRSSGGTKDNVPANSIVQPIDQRLLWYNPAAVPAIEKLRITKSLTCNNFTDAAGGRESESVNSIRVNAPLHFSAQNRVVTLQDYYSRIMSMPPEYGKIEKLAIKKGYSKKDDIFEQLKESVYAFIDFKKKNIQTVDAIEVIDDIYQQKQALDAYIVNNNENEEEFIRSITNSFEKMNDEMEDIIIYALSLNNFGQLIKTPQSLKNNVATYIRQFTPTSTSLRILDASIINIKVEFKVQIDSTIYEPQSVLYNCINAIRNHFLLPKMQIGKNIVKTVLYDILHNIQGVVSVPVLEFDILNGEIETRQYSNDIVVPTISRLYTYNGAVIECPSNAIFELKYPQYDIIGSTTI